MISILVVLGALAFPAITGVLERAKKVQAKNDLTQIVTAVRAYHTEYGRYPLDAGEQSNDVTFGASSYQDQLLNVLRANGSGRDDPANDNLNPRRIPFLTAPSAKDPINPKSGIVPDSAKTNAGMFVDPWGTPYLVRIDGNYDNSLPNPYASNAGSATLRQDVIAWSFGRDGKSSSSTTRLNPGGGSGDLRTGTNADDVLSWQ